MDAWVDLGIALSIMSSLCLLAFHAGRRLSRPRRRIEFLLIGALLLSIFSCFGLHASLGWAKAIPLSGVVLWSNLTPLFLAFGAGAATNSQALRTRIRPVTAVSLGGLSFVFLVTPMIRPWIAPPMIAERDRSQGVICLQTHEATCAAASAATLLRMHGIQSNERAMVGACLTSNRGTEALGLFRGLSVGSRENYRWARIASPDPSHWFAKQQLPNVALVRFPQDEFGPIDKLPKTNPRKFLGGRGPNRVGHAVVVVGFEDGKWTIADPAVGMVQWTDQELQNRFTGEAIYLAE